MIVLASTNSLDDHLPPGDSRGATARCKILKTTGGDYILMRTQNRFVPMRSVWLAIIFSLGLAIPAYAATIFTENYEVANVAALAERGWWPGFGTLDDDGSKTIQIVTAPTGRTGSVLRLQYQGMHINDNNNDKIVVNFPATPEIYVRYYKRTDPIPLATLSTYYETTSKQHYLKVDGTTSDGYPNFYTAHIWGARDLSLVTQNAVDTGTGGASNDYANGSKPMSDGRWYCVEYHIKMNTPGVANGVQEIWTDGTQTLGRYNRNFRDAAHANAAFTNIEIFRQAAHNQYRYEDDMVVATTRIGCSDNPSIDTTDTTPPLAPTGLSLR